MNEFARTSPYLDEPGRRLLWTLPLSLLIWLALLMAFSAMLELTAAPPPALQPVEARIVELPPEVGGLQGGPAPAKPAVAKPAAVVHHHIETHPHIAVRKVKPVARPIPPSTTGTAKPAVSAPESRSSAATPEKGAGVSGGSGVGSASGLGSDSTGARAIFAPVPKIPDDLREDTLNTVAIAHFKVSHDGQVQVNLVKPTANPELNEILLETLKQWRFFPAIRSGVAIASEFDIRIPVSIQ